MTLSKAFVYLILLVTLGFNGCSSVAHLRTADSPKAATTTGDPDAIQVYSVNSIGRSYQTLGVVVSSKDAGEDAQSAVSNLKEEAAKLGANAITDMNLEIDMGYWRSAIRATGIAVRY
jgi:uncharacterized protein YbjQ (UPF0145 family)